MKRISYAGRLGWAAMGVTMALSAMRWLPEQDPRPADYGPAGSAVEHAQGEPGDAVKRPMRRVRASSSMPYFSFARALRPRG
ncbi:hypothetical protein B1992_02985 [Pseudoxanthomonas broegbernensis]|uniref:Uncharacterized protein n=1 Tax=Pseudoxanthomonas broegbernensis TaxID=83619 RepID=A0A7V8GPA7_9GAMM|nr:hypothetical protein [Pseudoxanthomonas broegbernensis]KAF1687638.1 hypothetical protein B1992_02985 [Pseudoxanthomonas broegbernensis]MBB6064663.1 hypothetical protein [Pseudoxanthomonas broegbernensis]